MKLLLLVIALVGCGGKKEDAVDERRVACTAAIDRGVTMTFERRKAKGPMAKSSEAKKLADELAPKLIKTLADLCTTDQWPDTVVSCFQTSNDMSKCKDDLKPEQRARYTKAMMKIMLSKGLDVGKAMPQFNPMSSKGDGSDAGSGSGAAPTSGSDEPSSGAGSTSSGSN